ncbi:MAG: sigma-54 dependent transcriptional regulator [Polyangiales bacterium]|nr:sigma-54-dependent Fis family transcriptional regulator [Myxococcales bacterium]
MTVRSRGSVLIIDDEKNILSALMTALRVEHYDVDVAGSGALGLKRAREKQYDLVLLDVRMPDMDGLSLLKTLRAEGSTVPVIVMSGHGTIDTAVEATRLGAQDFLEKPISTDRLLLSIQRAIHVHELEDENRGLRRRAGVVDALVGKSAPMQALRERIVRVADSNAPVLILGERGTGKELVANAIHRGSKRAQAPFEKLNCAAVPAELIESELFGHEAGAFTGATKQRKGKFERASGGTLFLDEVGDMPSPMQAKLLRVLQEGEIERVGGSETLRVDVRVVAATNKALDAEIDAGRFRADLFDRLNVVPLRVPALRERSEDIPELVELFLKLGSEAHDRPTKSLTAAALERLTSYPYPGNVRELRNLLDRLIILSAGETITDQDARELLPLGGGAGGGGHYRPGVPLKEMLEEAERDLIQRALEHNKGHVTNTAAELGLERSHLYKKMKALGIRDREG